MTTRADGGMPEWPKEPTWESFNPQASMARLMSYQHARADAWEARARLLYAAVKAHNDACVAACGEGDQAGVAC